MSLGDVVKLIPRSDGMPYHSVQKVGIKCMNGHRPLGTWQLVHDKETCCRADLNHRTEIEWHLRLSGAVNHTQTAPCNKTRQHSDVRSPIYFDNPIRSSAVSNLLYPVSHVFGAIVDNVVSAHVCCGTRFLDRIDLVAFESSFLRGDFDLIA